MLDKFFLSKKYIITSMIILFSLGFFIGGLFSNLGNNQLGSLYKASSIECINQVEADELNKLTGKNLSIGDWCKETSLNLNYKNLTSLPSGVTKLTNLTELDLSGNQPTSLPAEIGNLTNLKSLFINLDGTRKGFDFNSPIYSKTTKILGNNGDTYEGVVTIKGNGKNIEISIDPIN